jgi:hypothetical protein
MEVTLFLIPANKGKDKFFKFQYLEEVLHNEIGIHFHIFQYILAIMPWTPKLKLNSDLQLTVSKSSNGFFFFADYTELPSVK